MLITFAEAESRSPIELTPDEMLAISEEIALKFSPDKASLSAIEHCPLPPATASSTPAVLTEQRGRGNFSYRELQTISQEISRRFMPKASNSVPEILLLPVDPHHLYAYWDTGSPQPQMPDHNLQKPLTLRIYWRPNAERNITHLNLCFDISADNAANRKKIRLPIDDTHYSAALGRLNPDHSLEVLAHSNLVHVPASPGRKRFAEEEPGQPNTAGKDPMGSPSKRQERLDAIRQEAAHFPESQSINPNSSRQTAATPEIAELMSLFSEIGSDSEPVPEPEPENPSIRASGRGL